MLESIMSILHKNTLLEKYTKQQAISTKILFSTINVHKNDFAKKKFAEKAPCTKPP